MSKTLISPRPLAKDHGGFPQTLTEASASSPLESGALCEGVLHDTIRVIQPILTQTTRCIQIVKEERGGLAALEMSQGCASGEKLPVWRFVTTTDLLLVAFAVLMHIPAVGKHISHGKGGRTGPSTLWSPHSVVQAAAVDHLGHTPQGGSVEAAVAMILSQLVAIPQATITALEFLATCISNSVSWPLPEFYQFFAFAGQQWREVVAPLISPAIFWTLILVIVVVVRIRIRLKRIYSEEVLVIRDVGMQLTTRNCRGDVVKRKFLDQSRIRTIFIHEAFFRQQVIFYLGVLVDNEEKVTVLFEETVPRLNVLRPILCGLRAVLFQESEEGPTLGELERSAGE